MRLFVAIELSEQMRAVLLAAQRSLAEFDRDVRWVREAQMHLTLKFLGEVPDADMSRVANAVQRSVAGCEGFSIQTANAGCFPEGGKVRVVWVGVADDGGALQRCQQRVEAELAEVGYPSEGRPFTAHLSLGRVRDDRTNGRLRSSVEALKVRTATQDVQGITLIASELSSSGSRYSRLGNYQLSC